MWIKTTISLQPIIKVEISTLSQISAGEVYLTRIWEEAQVQKYRDQCQALISQRRLVRQLRTISRLFLKNSTLKALT